MPVTKRKSPQKQSRQQKRYQRTRGKILDAARIVFTEKGLGAPLDDITELADVARGSLYYHFKSKEGLINFMVNDMLSELVSHMNTLCKDKEDLEPMLEGLIQAHIGFFTDRWQDFVLYYQGRADLILEDSYDGLEKPFIRYARSIEKLIDSVIEEPISSVRLQRIANAIAGFVAGYYSFASIASTGQDIDRDFKALRHAFVISLARFAREALPKSHSQLTK